MAGPGCRVGSGTQQPSPVGPMDCKIGALLGQIVVGESG